MRHSEHRRALWGAMVDPNGEPGYERKNSPQGARRVARRRMLRSWRKEWARIPDGGR